MGLLGLLPPAPKYLAKAKGKAKGGKAKAPPKAPKGKGKAGAGKAAAEAAAAEPWRLEQPPSEPRQARRLLRLGAAYLELR